MTVNPAETEDILKGLEQAVNRPQLPLHYAVLLQNEPSGTAPDIPEGKASRSLGDELQRYGLFHKDKGDEQIRLWREVIPKVHKTFLELQQQCPVRGKRARLVLDVEQGGLLYALVQDGFWLFAATLNQKAMNDGSAERELVELAQKLRRVLKPHQDMASLGTAIREQQ